MDAVTALSALKSGATTARQLLEGCLESIAAHNTTVNAVVHLDVANARESADRCDAAARRGEWLGPLHGLPVTVKECFDVAGMPTTWGDPALKHVIACHDSTVAQRLRDAGAVLFGKTNMPAYLGDWETDNRLFGSTRNPFDLDRSTGGSSGGSATAVACGFSYADIGSDQGGSIRLPAHYCGVFGLKPTWGMIPMRGHSWTGDLREPDIGVAGPIARSSADLSLLLDVLAKPPETAARKLSLPPSRVESLQGLRIAVMLDHPACPVDDAYAAVLEDTVAFLRDQSAVVDLSARPNFDPVRACKLMNLLVRAETSARHSPEDYATQRNLAAQPDGTRSESDLTNARGITLSHRDWLLLHEERLRICHAWERFFDNFDFFLCPVSASAAPPFRTAQAGVTRTIPVNGGEIPVLAQHFWFAFASLSYLPGCAAPVGFTDGGLPVGIQVVGPRFGDHSVIALSGLLNDRYMDRSQDAPIHKAKTIESNGKQVAT